MKDQRIFAWGWRLGWWSAIRAIAMRSIVLLPLIAGSAWISSAAQSRGSSPPPVSSSVMAHVYVQIDDESGNGVGFLSKRHFSLSVAGEPLPFSLANVTLSRKAGSSILQTYLLVLTPQFPPDGMKEPCRAFASELKVHWKIQIVDPSGTQAETIECGTGAAKRVIHTIRGSEMEALKQLGKSHGRRMVLYLSSESHVLDPALQKMANDAGAMIYDIGGRENNFYYDGSSSFTPPTGRATRHAGAFAPDVESSFVVNPSVARPERSIRSALRHAARNAEGFYVLTTRLCEPTSSLSLRLKLRSGLNVSAQVLADEGDAPRLEIVQ